MQAPFLVSQLVDLIRRQIRHLLDRPNISLDELFRGVGSAVVEPGDEGAGSDVGGAFEVDQPPAAVFVGDAAEGGDVAELVVRLLLKEKVEGEAG